MEPSGALAAIHGLIEAERDYVIGLTRDLVRIPSVNPKFETGEGLNREADVQTLLASHLEPLGLSLDRWDVFPGRPNLVGVLDGSAERSLLLNGHIDVVPVGDRAKWTVGPFGGEIAKGRIWGRGAIDMKCGVAASLAAVRAILKAGYRPEGRIDFHSVVDEEAGGFGSIEAAKRCPRAAGGIVTEPTWGKVLAAEGGLEWVRVVIPGKNAHSAWRYNAIYPQRNEPGRLEPGVNAVDYAARFIEQLRELERDWATTKSHPLLPPGVNTLHVGHVVAGAAPGPDGRPTILSNLAITPDCAAIDIDLKFLPQETKEQVRRDFEAFVHNWAQQYSWLRAHPPQVHWDLYGLHFPPLNTPVDHPLVTNLVAGRKRLGKETEVSGFIAVCDAAHYAGVGVPCVIYGCSGDGFHGVDEYVEIESLIETTKLIAGAVSDWCGLSRK
jgi:acetylornithine deacetylase/succinyl-diaminopimelate desuccinylase family protein